MGFWFVLIVILHYNKGEVPFWFIVGGVTHAKASNLPNRAKRMSKLSAITCKVSGATYLPLILSSVVRTSEKGGRCPGDIALLMELLP